MKKTIQSEMFETVVSGMLLDTIRHASQVDILDAIEVGGDLEVVTVGLMTSAVDGTNGLGINAGKAVAAAADGAMKGAGEVNATAVSAVRKGLSKFVPSNLGKKLTYESR